MATAGSYGEAMSFAYYPKYSFNIDIDGYVGGIIPTDSVNSTIISKGGKFVASKDDVVKALYRLNPDLDNIFETQDEFVEALVAAGVDAFQKSAASKINGLVLGAKPTF